MTAEVESLRRPARLQWLVYAVAAWCAFTVLAALTLFGQRPYLARELVKANRTAKDRKANYEIGTHVVNHDVSNILQYGIIQSLLSSFILGIVTFTVLRGRWWARWLLIAFATVLPVIFPVFGIGIVVQLITGLFSSFPGVYKALEILAGLCAAFAVAILFLPEVRAWFSGLRAQDKAERHAVLPARAAGARPVGLLGLLLGRGGRATGARAPLTQPVAPVVRPTKRRKPAADASAPAAENVPTVTDAITTDAGTTDPPAPASPPRPRRAAPKSREQ